MNKSESKYLNTSKRMYTALFQLITEKDFNSINVKELCNKAKINRSTFYSHYNNLNELLEESKKYIMNDFVSNFDQTTLFMDQPKELSDEIIINLYLTPYLKYIKDHKLVFKLFVENLKTFNVDEYYKFLLEHVLIPSIKKKGIDDKKKIDYLSRFYLTGITSIVMTWLNNNCEDDISYICDVILTCNKYSIFN